MSLKVLILHPRSRGFSHLRVLSLCGVLKQKHIEFKCIELLPEHRYSDSMQAQIFTQSQAAHAVLTVGPYLPALFTPFVHPNTPLWLDWPSDPLADGHAKNSAAREDNLLVPHNSHFSIMESVSLGLKRADQIGVISERARWSLLGQLLLLESPDSNPNSRIWTTPVCFDFPTPSLIAKERAQDEPMTIALCGSYNSWLWDKELMKGLEAFLHISPDSKVLLMGGSAEDHYDQGWIRAQNWGKSTPQAQIVGWCSEAEFEGYLRQCDVGIWLDRPGIEPLLGSRTRALFFAWVGLQIIGSISCELADMMSKKGILLSASTASEVQAKLLEAQSQKNTHLKQQQRFEALKSQSPEQVFKPLIEWLNNPIRLPSLLPEKVHQQAEIIQNLAQELKRIHTSPTWKYGSKLNRMLNRIFIKSNH